MINVYANQSSKKLKLFVKVNFIRMGEKRITKAVLMENKAESGGDFHSKAWRFGAFLQENEIKDSFGREVGG